LNERKYPRSLLEQAKSLAAALKNIDANLQVGDLSVSTLIAEIERSVEIQRNINILEIQLTDQRNQRDAQHGELWNKVKRMRAAVKAIYGDDSSQFEMAGGKRLSERKPYTRKKVAN
jgi:hypothetical protein